MCNKFSKFGSTLHVPLQVLMIAGVLEIAKRLIKCRGRPAEIVSDLIIALRVNLILGTATGHRFCSRCSSA
jgi:hypothetical protein